MDKRYIIVKDKDLNALARKINIELEAGYTMKQGGPRYGLVDYGKVIYYVGMFK